jgi:hypothetical protein
MNSMSDTYAKEHAKEHTRHHTVYFNQDKNKMSVIECHLSRYCVYLDNYEDDHVREESYYCQICNSILHDNNINYSQL